eukprot:GHVT01097982.1.p1 GENE.GHVT01097982.1~~GHVT01097982.1.p1  ORF type:complete len:406 (+),score=67.71 GHVT01097982.1:180-1397(+)
MIAIRHLGSAKNFIIAVTVCATVLVSLSQHAEAAKWKNISIVTTDKMGRKASSENSMKPGYVYYFAHQNVKNRSQFVTADPDMGFMVDNDGSLHTVDFKDGKRALVSDPTQAFVIDGVEMKMSKAPKMNLPPTKHYIADYMLENDARVKRGARLKYQSRGHKRLVKGMLYAKELAELTDPLNKSETIAFLNSQPEALKKAEDAAAEARIEAFEEGKTPEEIELAARQAATSAVEETIAEMEAVAEAEAEAEAEADEKAKAIEQVVDKVDEKSTVAQALPLMAAAGVVGATVGFYLLFRLRKKHKFRMQRHAEDLAVLQQENSDIRDERSVLKSALRAPVPKSLKKLLKRKANVSSVGELSYSAVRSQMKSAMKKPRKYNDTEVSSRPKQTSKHRAKYDSDDSRSS